jgi:hypothetical protein
VWRSYQIDTRMAACVDGSMGAVHQIILIPVSLRTQQLASTAPVPRLLEDPEPPARHGELRGRIVAPRPYHARIAVKPP